LEPVLKTKAEWRIRTLLGMEATTRFSVRRSRPPNNGGLPELACGYYLPMYNICTNMDLLSPIVDHGPGAACTLDYIPCQSVSPGVWISLIGFNANYIQRPRRSHFSGGNLGKLYNT